MQGMFLLLAISILMDLEHCQYFWLSRCNCMERTPESRGFDPWELHSVGNLISITSTPYNTTSYERYRYSEMNTACMKNKIIGCFLVANSFYTLSTHITKKNHTR